jgi:hypothetical protein
MRNLSILFLLAAGILSANAQDVITLRNGNEIKAKVTEITSSEIKYKRFENLEGPTVVMEKSEVFVINYENGTREVINAMTTTATTASKVQTAPKSISGPHRKDFYTGIYVNPLGFLQAGPIVGAEFTFKRRFIVDAHLRFPSAGLLTGVLWDYEDANSITGMGVGLHAKYFTGGPKGGFYVGPAFELWSTSLVSDGSNYYDGTGLLIATNPGYKFQFPSGLYMRTGAFLGISYNLDVRDSYYDYSGYIYFFGMLEVSLGIAF